MALFPFITLFRYFIKLFYSFHYTSFPFLKGCRLEKGHIVPVLRSHSLKKKYNFTIFVFTFVVCNVTAGAVLINKVDIDVTIVISDPRRGCYIVSHVFIFFLFSFFFRHFCPGHISGTITRRDYKLSVLLDPAV